MPKLKTSFEIKLAKSIPSVPKSPLAKALAKAKREKLEDEFRMQLRAVMIPVWQRQWQFDSARKWKFDFCWPSLMVAVEIEGLVAPWIGKSRHTTNSGYQGDLEKYNRAAALGWTVGRFSGGMVKSGAALAWTEAILKRKVAEANA